MSTSLIRHVRSALERARDWRRAGREYAGDKWRAKCRREAKSALADARLYLRLGQPADWEQQQ